jgi:hypothetical protein
VTYHHTLFNVLRIGGQLQFRTAEDTEEPRVFDDSVGAQGEEGFDVLAIGVHYGFSFELFHRR